MCRNLLSLVFALFLLLAGGPSAHAACTAGNPSATLVESTPSSVLSDNGDGTVSDGKTGLMWKQCSEGLSGANCATGTAATMDWPNALHAAITANTAVFAGHNDWRLPNYKELQSIVETCGYGPSINQVRFPATPSYYYWSSSTYNYGLPSHAWMVGFNFGVGVDFSKAGGSFNVRLVRGGQSYDALSPTASVIYDGNGNTGGSVPVDPGAYISGATVTVLGNTGGLVKAGSIFAGWNTAMDGSGTNYAGGATFTMGGANVTLYARWTDVAVHNVIYDGNLNTGGSVPVDGNNYTSGDTVTVLGNTGSLVRSGYSFAGWNTAANGSGTSYVGGNTFSMGSANVTLYAQWSALPTYAVTYNGNGNTGGSAPVDPGSPYASGATVTVLGNTGSLARSGYSFAGWNTAANGSGTSYVGGNTFSMGGANVALYAQWAAAPAVQASIPTLSPRGVLLLAGLLGLLGWLGSRRRV